MVTEERVGEKVKFRLSGGSGGGSVNWNGTNLTDYILQVHVLILIMIVFICSLVLAVMTTESPQVMFFPSYSRETLGTVAVEMSTEPLTVMSWSVKMSL